MPKKQLVTERSNLVLGNPKAMVPEVWEGFELLQSSFELSIAEIEALDSQGIDEAMICDFFVNYRLEISDIANLANTTEAAVIKTLLRRDIVRDRRSNTRDAGRRECWL